MAAEVTIVIKTIDESTKPTKKLSAEFKEFGKSLAKIAGTAAVVGIALKKAFDLGEQGAQVRQMIAAGEAMGINLANLRVASNNTISDFNLLSSVQTLLIGTQGELNEAFLENADQLLRIAKAANKLNPSLGDTEFLFQSIAKGIKRGSPLILDNLGLIVSLGRANEAYAKSLGKTVAELTAEEQTMALLNETLRAGDVLLDQAAKVTENSVDSFAKLRTAVANLADSLKSDLGGALDGAAEGLADFINAEVKEASFTAELTQLWREGKISLEELNEATRFGLGLNEEYARQLIAVAKAHDILIRGGPEVIEELENIFNEMEDGTVATEDLTDGMNDLAMAEGNVSDKAGGATQSLQEFFDSLDRSKLDIFQEGLEALEFEEIGGKQVVDFAKDLETAFNVGIIGAEGLEEGLQAGFVAEQALAVALGDTSAWEAAALVAEQLAIGPAAALALVQNLEGALNALPSYLEILVNIIKTGSGAGIVAGSGIGSFGGAGTVDVSGGSSFETGFATGGSFLVPGQGGTDSQFVGFMATPGEKVTVGTPGQQGESGGGNTINNFNGPVTISSSDTELLLQMGLDISGARVI